MADGTGFAHYEFPSGQPVGYGDTAFPHYQFPSGEEGLLGVEAGSLIELASGEYKQAFESPENYMGAIGESRRKSGFNLELDALLREQEAQDVRRWQFGEAQKQAGERGASSVPWEFQSVMAGPVAAYEGLGAAILRPIDPETSNWMVRAAQVNSMGMEMGMKKEEVSEARQYVNHIIFGSARSFTQAVIAAKLAALTGGNPFAFMALGAAGVEANDSYVEAIDWGLTPKKAAVYAAKQGAFEGLVMTGFQVAGLGGLESMLVGKAVWSGLSKEFGKRVLSELTEEEITTVMQAMTRAGTMPDAQNPNVWAGEDGNFIGSPMYEDMMMTAAQTLFMMGYGKTGEFMSSRNWSFLIEPSRNSILVMPDSVRGPLEEKHGDLNKKEAREAASDELLNQHVESLKGTGEIDAEIEYWAAVAEDEGRTAKAREAAAGVASRLDGGEFGAKGVGKELLEIIAERMDRKPETPDSAAKATLPAPAVAQERKVEVPPKILQQDPNAEIVDHLDLIPMDASDDTLVKMLSVVKELGRETRGGRDIRFVQTEDPYIQGEYTGDGIYLTIPKVKKYMKDGVLDEEGLRKALTGTFAHEWTHELKRNNPEVWKQLYNSLKDDSKYGPILAKGREDFLHQFTLSEYIRDSEGNKKDPYADLRGEANKDRLEGLADEESLSYLMDDHFITTGLVAKMAKTNSNAFEMLRDWLRRIRNSLFGDKLYRGMISAFNEVASDMGIQPIATRPATEPTARKPRRKKAKKATKKSRKHVLKKGLPEWAEKPVEELDKRGSKVVQKNHASPTSVVVTVRTKAGNTQIVTLRSVSGRAEGVEKTVVKATNENYNDRMEDAVSGAVAFDESVVAEPEPEEQVEERVEVEAAEEPTTTEDLTDVLNDDLEKLYLGLREGYSDEEAAVESTDIDAFLELAVSSKKSDESGMFLEEGDVRDIDVDYLKVRGLVFEDEEGRFRLTGIGERALSWEGKDVVGEFGEISEEAEEDYDDRWSLGVVEGLTEDEVRLMDDAITEAEFALRDTEYQGRHFELFDNILGDNHLNEVVKWMRGNKVDSLIRIAQSLWPGSGARNAPVHDREANKMYRKIGGQRLATLVSDLKSRMVTGRSRKPFHGLPVPERFGMGDTRAVPALDMPDAVALLNKARAMLPTGNEYRQLKESSDRLSVKIHDLDLPDEYFDDTSKHHVDERTRAAVDKVRAYAHIKTPKETRTHLQDEVWGQSNFNKDPLGTIKSLIRKGLEGEIFTSRDLVMLDLAHTHVLSIMDGGNLTAAEMEDLTQKKIWLVQYSNESHSEWGRAGSMMRDKVESVRERQRRAIDKAMFSIPNNLKRRLAAWQGRLLRGRPEAAERVAEIRAEWHQANLEVEKKLMAKGWDLGQLDKYMGSREAVEAFVYEILKEKGEIGTAGHILYELFINFILSGPLTHMANVSSNVLMSLYEFGPKRHAHALLNEVTLAVGLGDKMAPRIGELPHLYAAAWRGFIEGSKHAYRTVISEEGDFERSLGVEQGRTKFGRQHQKHISGFLGRGVRFFGTTGLNALDSWQKSMNAHMEVVSLAYRDAKVNGLVDDQVGDHMTNVLNDKSHRLWSDALDKARDMVFQGEPSDIARGVLTLRATTPGVKWLLPFILTPDNILRKGVAYSPLGALTLPYGAYKGFKTGDWSTMGERSIQQLIAWSIVAAMLGDDEERPLITGTRPSEPKEWAGQVRSQTIPAMSIRVGDGYFSYARFEPFATWLALSKDLVAALKHGEVGFTYDKLTESMVELAKEKTFMRTVSDIGYLLNNPRQGGKRIAGGFITATIPNIYKQIVRSGRDTKVERRDWGDDGRLEMWGKNLIRKMEIPVYEEYDKYDQYGKKIPENWNPFSGTKASFWYKLLVPAKSKHVHEGVADKVLRRFNEQNPQKRKGISELDPYFLIKKERKYLTKPEYEEYTKLAGSIFGNLVDSEAVDLEEPKEGEVADLWDSNWKAARSAAQEILKRKWADEPYEDEIKAVAQTIYQNHINKRITILGRSNLVLWKQDDKTKKLPLAKRKEKLDIAQRELLETKMEAVEWLVRQGYTAENFPKLTSRKYTPSRGRALRSFRELSGGVEGVRKRTVPPRVRAAG